jgi:hypothetical protein
MREPVEIVNDLESRAASSGLSTGLDERFMGYAVIGQPFASGHILALRRFPASSIGPGYTSIWHRDPSSKWTFYQDAPPQVTCTRYFGKYIDEVVEQPIRIQWTGPRSFSVATADLEWAVGVRPTMMTRLMNAMGDVLTESMWQNPKVLSWMGAAAKLTLGTGDLRLAGHLPNGQSYIANPKKIWIVESSQATVRQVQLGMPGPLPVQAHLGDFIIPQRGLFAIAEARMEKFDSIRHSGTTSKSDAIFGTGSIAS